MTLDLTEEETAALERLLTNSIDADHYPLSPSIQLLKGILAKIRPEPKRESLPGTEAWPRAAILGGFTAEALRAAARWPIPQTRLDAVAIYTVEKFFYLMVGYFDPVNF
jgi:hypothetical protein